MPQGDGTGPNGAGPLTGRGLGPCQAGITRMPFAGRCRGMRGRRLFGQGAYQAPSASDEKAILADDAKLLKEELDAVEERLADLKKDKK